MDMKPTKDGRLSSSHHLTLLVEVLKKKKNLAMILQFLKKRTNTVIENEIKMPCIG